MEPPRILWGIYPDKILHTLIVSLEIYFLTHLVFSVFLYAFLTKTMIKKTVMDIITINIEKNNPYPESSVITNGIALPPIIPTTNNIVKEISFPEPNILPADDVSRGGIPEKPIPVNPIPMKLTICIFIKIAHDIPARLIIESMIRSVPAFIL
jgi:hypothetical protein